MSIMYPTKVEIKQYLVNTLKEYLIHTKHLLICPWRRDKGREYCCLICVGNGLKKLRRHNKKSQKRHNNFTKNWRQSDFINMLRARHPIEVNKNYYVNTQLDPIVRNLWLYKPIRDIYRQTIKNGASKYYPTYALVRHKCGHRYIDKIICSTDKKIFICELKYLRMLNCNDCTAIENKHILLRWFDWKYNNKKRDILKFIRHIGHRISNKPNFFCSKCIEHALVCKIKSQKHKIIMKF